MTQESQLELETGSSESSPPNHSESSAQSCQTLTLDLRDLHQSGIFTPDVIPDITPDICTELVLFLFRWHVSLRL